MLGSKSQNNEQILKSMNMIGTGTKITGDVHTEGDIRIDGTVNGTVHSKSKLAVGESGLVEGNIHCANGSIEGRVKGNLFVSELIFLRKTAVIDGDIVTKKLVVEEGARLNGNCNMTQNPNMNPVAGSADFQGKLKKENVA